MKRLVVYAGANGAGKSTLRADGADPVALEIDPDRIAREINSTDPRAVDFAAGKEALRRFDQALAAGLSLSLETTLTRHTVLARMQAAKDAGYDVVLRRGRDERRQRRACHRPRRRRRALDRAGGGAPPGRGQFGKSAGRHRHRAPGRAAGQQRPRSPARARMERGRVLHQTPDLPPWLAGQLPRIAAELERVARQSRPTPPVRP